MARTNTTPGKKWLKDEGFEVPDTGMAGHIIRWWDWMQATSAFYDETVNDGDRTFKVERITMCPGKMVCEDWASIVFNEETTVSLGDDSENKSEEGQNETLTRTAEWLDHFIEESGLLECSAPLERSFGLGTAAWALGLENINEDGSVNENARVMLQWYDARSIIPLSWASTGVTAAAFVLPVVINGKQFSQVTLHAPDAETGYYFIKTAFFNGSNQRQYFDGYTDEVKTNCTTPTFAIIKPAIDNTYEDYSPLGVSVLDRCLGAIKVADGAFDNLWNDLFLGQKLLMMSESLLRKDANGECIVPRARRQQLFLNLESDSINSEDFIKEYNPDLRVDDNRNAISTGLALLGKRAGFGLEYYKLDKDGSIEKTAKEVAADNAELMRNAHKHEKIIETALIQLCTSAVELARQFIDSSLQSVDGLVHVNFGDTIIDDEVSQRENDRADVAASLMPKWKYIEKWHGVDEATAKQWAEDPEAIEDTPLV